MFVSWSKITIISVNILFVLKTNVYSCVGCWMFVWILSYWSQGLLSSIVLLMRFCLHFLTISENGVLKTPIIILNLFISSYQSVKYSRVHLKPSCWFLFLCGCLNFMQISCQQCTEVFKNNSLFFNDHRHIIVYSFWLYNTVLRHLGNLWSDHLNKSNTQRY